MPTTAEKRSQGLSPVRWNPLREEVDTPPTSLVAVAGVLPSHRYDQRTLTEALLESRPVFPSAQDGGMEAY
jgi:hypothetical protein